MFDPTVDGKMDICQEKCIHEDRVRASVAGMPDPDLLRNLADLFKALGDPTRLKIVTSLLREELCVCDLSVVCGLSDSAVSHQLRMLRTLRIVDNRREGKIVYYHLADEHVRQLIANSLDHLGHGD
ncbi:MAG: ArsR/SmtB family transcription factor [Desulfobacterales bacterium]